MGNPRISDAEIDRQGQEIYARLRPHVETKENIGKVISIDVETEEYAIDQDSFRASDHLLAKNPGAALFGLRIGYDAVYALGGGLTRSKQ